VVSKDCFDSTRPWVEDGYGATARSWNDQVSGLIDALMCNGTTVMKMATSAMVS
jgi:hypothetical protein